MVSLGTNHQGVVGQMSPVKVLDFSEYIELLKSDRERCIGRGQTMDGYLIVALDGIEDPRNAGAIIRSAESQGASGSFPRAPRIEPQ